MNWGTKFVRTLLAPLVPPLRVGRILRTLMSRDKFGEIGFFTALPSLLLGLIAHAMGEVAGYWGDARGAEMIYRRFELDRLACVDAIDRAFLLPAGSR